jgi:hypothetical protein
MSESDQSPVWHQLMRDDIRRPPTWRQWVERHGRWRAAVLLPEWLSEWTVHWSRDWDLVKVLELAGKFALLFSVVVGAWTYFAEAGEREKARQDAIKAKHYRAWELIYTARGSPGDGGRRDALRDLHKDGVSLAGVPLSKANLNELKLPRADLGGADLTGARLSDADLSGARLSDADLSGVIFCNTTMTDGSINNSGCPSEPSTTGAQPSTLPTPPLQHPLHLNRRPSPAPSRSDPAPRQRGRYSSSNQRR